MWEKKYSAGEYHYGVEPNDFLRENVDQIPAGPVLCLAEGEGRNAVFLAECGYAVTAVEQSSAGIAKGRALAKLRDVDVTFVQTDIADYDFGRDKWAGIVSIFCHLPPKLRASVHTRVRAGLRPGGVFLLEAYRPDQLKNKTGGPPIEDLMLTRNILLDELGPLKFKHLEEVDRTIIEGIGHTGLGSVVQAIAIK